MSHELKTQKNSASVKKFLSSLEDATKKEEALRLLEIFEEVCEEPGVMWGDSIIGFGSYKYTTSAGKSYEWMETGFSPRKNAFSLYIMPGYQFDTMQDLLSQLGKYKTGKSCLYIKKLSDIDINILKKIITKGISLLREKHAK